MARPKKKVAKKMGRKTAWETTIKPNLDKIIEQYANGATLAQIASHWHIAVDTVNETKNRFPEFSDALARARIGREQELRGALWKLATGKATRKEVSYDTDNEKTRHVKIIELEPDKQSAMMLLKRDHGWSDNPIVDEALARTLDGDEMRKRICEILNVPNTGDKSNEQDDG